MRNRRSSSFLGTVLIASALTFAVVWHMTPDLRRAAIPQGAIARERSVYYPNCAAARVAGAAPVYRSQPGYRPEAYADDDGIASEPYHGG